MVCEGYSISPISNSSLYVRLKNIGVISGAISTLTSRKHIIQAYKQKQLDEIGGILGESAKQGSTQSRNELIKANARLREQVEKSKSQLAQNTETLIEIVEHIKLTGAAQNIERVLSPFLIRELIKKDK
jgi:hypothetical protein